MVLFSKGLTARRLAVLAARPDSEAFLFLPEGTLLMPADPFQLLLHTHSGPPTLTRTQLLLHGAAWTLLLETTATDTFKALGTTTTTPTAYRTKVNVTENSDKATKHPLVYGFTRRTGDFF